MGAERAGNADGSIPAWSGGFTAQPAGNKAGEIKAVQFGSEKPLLKITAANVDQYADHLTETTRQLPKSQPNFRLDVYPTHRTAGAPQHVYDNTAKNAVNAKLDNGVMSVSGAYGGVPFPIPKSGGEILWNHFLSWKGYTVPRCLRRLPRLGRRPQGPGLHARGAGAVRVLQAGAARPRPSTAGGGCTRATTWHRRAAWASS